MTCFLELFPVFREHIRYIFPGEGVVRFSLYLYGCCTLGAIDTISASIDRLY